MYVAPYAGAWIEMQVGNFRARINTSLPTRERGLKFISIQYKAELTSRSLRGSVD